MHDLYNMHQGSTGPPGESPRALLRRLGLKPRKSLGQNFLIDKSVLKRIVAAACLTPDDTVIEVGAGLGLLTGTLADQARKVIAVETDPHLIEALQELMAGKHNVEIVLANILEVPPRVLLEKAGYPDGVGPYKVVANIPYYITSPILRHFLEADVKPALMVVMVQREVARAITAGPGDMSMLSVGVQFYAIPKIVGRVPARSFYPPPKVESAILRLELRDRPAVDVPDTPHFFAVARAGFSAPRKQIRNSLAQGLDIPTSESAHLLEKAGIDPKRRAETLGLDEWARVDEAVRTEADLHAG